MLDSEALYRETVRVYEQISPPVAREGGCLYWSLAAVIAASNLGLPGKGYEFQVQGGTASFIRLAPEDDDGKETTHNAFSYVFEDTPFTRMKIAMNELPEMHCWVACARTKTIFDPTTGFLPDQCMGTARMPWTAKKSPPYLLFSAGSEPDWAFYEPSLPATVLAHQYIKNFIAERLQP